MTKAEQAVVATLRAILSDGRKAYLMGWGTEAFSRLTEAEAERLGEDPEAYRDRFWRDCRPERVVRSEESA